MNHDRLTQYQTALRGLQTEFEVLKARLEPTRDSAVFEHFMLRDHERLLEQVDTFSIRRQHEQRDVQ